MNEPRTQKLCPKHQVALVDGYCPTCYPFPRVYCKGTKSNGEPCGQPLTNPKHRERQEGARCHKNRMEKEKRLSEIARENLRFVESGGPSYRRRRYRRMDTLGELF